MTNTKHTKGPWRVDQDSERTYIMGVDQPKGYSQETVTVATLGFRNTKPNAQLIAAAPELLEALELARSFMVARLAIESSNDPDSNITHHIQELLMDVNEAITKARGES